ncbi:uncharacterized protein LOC109538054 [Dendroctonus ponderosae]|uniref:uncharacterized protein LOC109538054 n=1 Tax=Dendroctonus ponderosae TaxID=77166 RepID=UPI002035935A|nr:uncharacterized protein LOC109538054 [Dendroctonus ponderosae]
MDSPGEILSLCRLCLVKDQVNIPIFEEQGDIRQIFLKISSCLPVTITRHDQLPKRICDACSNKLDLLYEFWNSSASAEKTLLSWLGQAGVEDAGEKISAVAQQIAKPAETLVKEESEALDESNLINESRDSFDDQSLDEGTKDEAEAPPPKRARRTAAVKAQINITPESDEDEDDDFDAGEAMTKMEDESEESESELKDDPSYSELPGTSADDDQAGPSGVGKDGVEAPSIIADNDARPNQFVYSCCKCKAKFDQLADLTRHIVNRCSDKCPSPMLARQVKGGGLKLAEKSLKRKLFHAETFKADSKRKSLLSQYVSPINVDVSATSKAQSAQSCLSYHKSFSPNNELNMHLSNDCNILSVVKEPTHLTKVKENICKFCHCKFKSSYSLKTHFLTYGKSCKTGSRHKVNKEMGAAQTIKATTHDRTHLVEDEISVQSAIHSSDVTKMNQPEPEPKNTCEIIETMQVSSTANVTDQVNDNLASETSCDTSRVPSPTLSDTSKLKTCIYCQQAFCFYYELKKHMSKDCQKLSAIRKQCKRTLFQKNIYKYCSGKFTSTSALKNQMRIYSTKFDKNEQRSFNSLRKKYFAKLKDGQNQKENSYKHKRRAAVTNLVRDVVRNAQATMKSAPVLIASCISQNADAGGSLAKVTIARTLSDSSKAQKSSALMEADLKCLVEYSNEKLISDKEQSSLHTYTQQNPKTLVMRQTGIFGKSLETDSHSDKTPKLLNDGAIILQPDLDSLKPNHKKSQDRNSENRPKVLNETAIQPTASNGLKPNAKKSQGSHSKKSATVLSESAKIQQPASSSLKPNDRKFQDSHSEKIPKILNESAKTQQPASSSLKPNEKKSKDNNLEKRLNQSARIQQSSSNSLKPNDKTSKDNNLEKRLNQSARIQQSSSNSLKPNDKTSQDIHSEKTPKTLNESAKTQQPSSSSLKLNYKKCQDDNLEKTLEGRKGSAKIQQPSSNSLKPNDKKSQDSHSEKIPKILNESAKTQQPSSSSLKPNDKKSQDNNLEKTLEGLKESAKIQQPSSNSLKPNDKKSQASHSEETPKIPNGSAKTQQPASSSLKPIVKKSQDSHSEKTPKTLNESAKTQQPSSSSLKPNYKKCQDSHSEETPKILNGSAKTQQPASSSLKPNDKKSKENNLEKRLNQSARIQQPSSNSLKPSDKKSQDSQSEKTPKTLNESAKTQPSSSSLKPNDKKPHSSHSEKTSDILNKGAKRLQPSSDTLKLNAKKSHVSSLIVSTPLSSHDPSEDKAETSKAALKCRFVCTYCNLRHISQSDLSTHKMLYCKMATIAKLKAVTSTLNYDTQTSSSRKIGHESTNQSPKISALEDRNVPKRFPEMGCNLGKTPMLVNVIKPTECAVTVKSPFESLKADNNKDQISIGSNITGQVAATICDGSETFRSQINANSPVTSSIKIEEDSADTPPKSVENAVSLKIESTDENVTTLRTDAAEPKDAPTSKTLLVPVSEVHDQLNTDPIPREVEEITAADIGNLNDEIKLEIDESNLSKSGSDSITVLSEELQIGTVKSEPEDFEFEATQIVESDFNTLLNKIAIEDIQNLTANLKTLEPSVETNIDISMSKSHTFDQRIHSRIKSESDISEGVIAEANRQRFEQPTATVNETERLSVQSQEIIEFIAARTEAKGVTDTKNSEKSTSPTGSTHLVEARKTPILLKETVCNIYGCMFEDSFDHDKGETRSKVCKCMINLQLKQPSVQSSQDHPVDDANLNNEFASQLDVLELQPNISMEFESDSEGIHPAITCDQCSLIFSSNIELKFHKCTFGFNKALETVSEVRNPKHRIEKNLFKNSSTTDHSEIKKSSDPKDVFDLRHKLNKNAAYKAVKLPSLVEANAKQAGSNQKLIRRDVDRLEETKTLTGKSPLPKASTAANESPNVPNTEKSKSETSSSASKLPRRSNEITSNKSSRLSQTSVRSRAPDKSSKRKPSIYCELCGTTIRNVLEIDYPRCGHTVSAFRCPVCGDRYPNIIRLIAHIDSQHPDRNKVIEKEMQTPPSRGTKYYCCSCGYQFCFIKNLMDHMISHHKFFHRNSNDTVHPPIIYPGDPTMKGFACTACDNSLFATLEELFRHEDVSKSHKKYFRLFGSIESNYHRIEERKFDYVCFVCDLGFVSFRSLRIHMLKSAHHDELNLEVWKQAKLRATQERQGQSNSLIRSNRPSEVKATSLQAEGKVLSNIGKPDNLSQCPRASSESNLNDRNLDFDDEPIPVIDLGQDSVNTTLEAPSSIEHDYPISNKTQLENPSAVSSTPQLVGSVCALNTSDLLSILQGPSDTEMESCNVTANDVEVLMAEMYSGPNPKEHQCFGCRERFISRKLLEKHACSGPF